MKSDLDKKHIESKLMELKTYVETLKQMQSVSFDELKKDPIKLGGIKYYLQISIECCLDIGAHFISRLRLRRYEGYKDIFTILGEANVIPKPIGHNFARNGWLQKYAGAPLLGN